MNCISCLTVNPKGFDHFSLDEFKEWKKTKQNLLKDYLIWNADSRWGMLSCRVQVLDPISVKKKEFDIQFPFDQENGNIFEDSDKKVIQMKMGILFSLRPLVTLVKAIYHLVLGGILNAAIQYGHEDIDWEEMKTRMIHSLVDTVRGPIYGIALTFIALAGLLLSPLSSSISYDIRNVYGRVENHLMWGTRSWECYLHTMAPCMQPFQNLMHLQPLQNNSIETFEDRLQKMIKRLDKESEIYSLVPTRPTLFAGR